MSKPAAKAHSSRSAARSRPKSRKGPEEEKLTRSLVKHGQAVEVPPGSPLPPGATHELVKDENGELRPVRRRFSAI
jgi:hypothetical protein